MWLQITRVRPVIGIWLSGKIHTNWSLLNSIYMKGLQGLVGAARSWPAAVQFPDSGWLLRFVPRICHETAIWFNDKWD